MASGGPRTSVGARLIDAAVHAVGTPVYVAACVLGAIGQAVGGVVALARAAHPPEHAVRVTTRCAWLVRSCARHEC